MVSRWQVCTPLRKCGSPAGGVGSAPPCQRAPVPGKDEHWVKDYSAAPIQTVKVESVFVSNESVKKGEMTLKPDRFLTVLVVGMGSTQR